MELLPCPFCGGEALPTAHLTYNWFAPVCRRCNARGPSVKIERDSDPQEMRNLMNQADENWNRRASPASAPEGQKPVASVFADEDCTKFIAKNMSHLRPMAKWWDLYIVPQADAPTPPVSEDRKDAERFREGWKHSCNALCMEIELWIDRCPHCGRPAPKAPTMQEDKI